MKSYSAAYTVDSTMDNSKGSIILKALFPSADHDQLTAYLEKRAKSIPPEKIPSLLKNLPVVLSRNVNETTGTAVIQQLKELGAEALFIPGEDEDQDPEDTFEQEGETGLQDRMQSASGAHAGSKIHPALLQQQSSPLKRSLIQANKEICIVAALLAGVWMLNYSLASNYLLLSLYSLPTILSGYYFGRRQAMLTACASILLVSCISYYNPGQLNDFTIIGLGEDNAWYHLATWSAVLLVIAYTMGILHEHNVQKMEELQQTYQGTLLILRHFITQDEAAENHCFRVSIYAARIASYLGLDKGQIEDIRSAAILHDLAKFKTSRDILKKAALLNRQRQIEGISSIQDSDDTEDPLRGSMGRILPLLLGHHEQFSNAHVMPKNRIAIPAGARILAVADAYDTLTIDNPYRKAISPQAAKKKIQDGAGTEFDPEVVHAFVSAFDRREMELPNILL